MISSYQLTPDRGTLKGGGLELRLQVPIQCYQVDFLANKHLVIEIDGAAYHSSPDAAKRDRIRDQFLINSGYMVLRIPAKIVFNSPSEAVQRVRCAISNLAHERSIRAQEAVSSATVQKPDPPFTFFGSLGKALQAGYYYMDETLFLQKAKDAFNQASLPEVHLIEGAMKLGKQKMEDEVRRSRLSPRENELYLESLRQLRAVLGPSSSPQPVRPFRLPEIDPDPYKTLIKEMYSALLDERLHYFEDIRKTLEKDSELAKYVKEALERLVKNSDDLWHLINPIKTCNTVNRVAKTAVYGSNWMDSVLAKQGITLDEIFKQAQVEIRAGESSHLPPKHLTTEKTS